MSGVGASCFGSQEKVWLFVNSWSLKVCGVESVYLTSSKGRQGRHLTAVRLRFKGSCQVLDEPKVKSFAGPAPVNE